MCAATLKMYGPQLLLRCPTRREVPALVPIIFRTEDLKSAELCCLRRFESKEVCCFVFMHVLIHCHEYACATEVRGLKEVLEMHVEGM